MSLLWNGVRLLRLLVENLLQSSSRSQPSTTLDVVYVLG